MKETRRKSVHRSKRRIAEELTQEEGQARGVKGERVIEYKVADGQGAFLGL